MSNVINRPAEVADATTPARGGPPGPGRTVTRTTGVSGVVPNAQQGDRPAD
ncbi:hypothetical protein [Curtobacterium sp. DN_7.5]|uniref:hypothetical protein n=1 Tax=Curtobacterium sp. DN_7.5 TaxID=3049047 RepID=UPI001F55F2DD|nr:hypothetical protein [Curtobacterium sp. DN_7.5]